MTIGSGVIIKKANFKENCILLIPVLNQNCLFFDEEIFLAN